MTLNVEQLGILQNLTAEMMTDEESGDEGVLIERMVGWRSEVVHILISEIDHHINNTDTVRKTIIRGELSNRQPSRKFPAFFIFIFILDSRNSNTRSVELSFSQNN